MNKNLIEYLQDTHKKLEKRIEILKENSVITIHTINELENILEDMMFIANKLKELLEPICGDIKN